MKSGFYIFSRYRQVIDSAWIDNEMKRFVDRYTEFKTLDDAIHKYDQMYFNGLDFDDSDYDIFQFDGVGWKRLFMKYRITDGHAQWFVSREKYII